MEAPAPGGNPGRAVERSDTSKSTARDVGNPAHTFAEQFELIAANDRQWFEQHPRARWRIRPTEPGQYPCGPQMAVRPFGPARMRFSVWGQLPLGLTDRGIELFMRAVLPPAYVRLCGLSCTTDRAVEQSFAHGHRGMRVPDAVVATASISKDRIFTVFVDRQESEALVDPAHLVTEDVAPYRERGQ